MTSSQAASARTDAIINSLVMWKPLCFSRLLLRHSRAAVLPAPIEIRTIAMTRRRLPQARRKQASGRAHMHDHSVQRQRYRPLIDPRGDQGRSERRHREYAENDEGAPRPYKAAGGDAPTPVQVQAGQRRESPRQRTSTQFLPMADMGGWRTFSAAPPRLVSGASQPWAQCRWHR
jgi:hypothetical protein